MMIVQSRRLTVSKRGAPIVVTVRVPADRNDIPVTVNVMRSNAKTATMTGKVNQAATVSPSVPVS